MTCGWSLGMGQTQTGERHGSPHGSCHGSLGLSLEGWVGGQAGLLTEPHRRAPQSQEETFRPPDPA